MKLIITINKLTFRFKKKNISNNKFDSNLISRSNHEICKTHCSFLLLLIFILLPLLLSRKFYKKKFCLFVPTKFIYFILFSLSLDISLIFKKIKGKEINKWPAIRGHQKIESQVTDRLTADILLNLITVLNFN